MQLQKCCRCPNFSLQSILVKNHGQCEDCLKKYGPLPPVISVEFRVPPDLPDIERLSAKERKRLAQSMHAFFDDTLRAILADRHQ